MTDTLEDLLKRAANRPLNADERFEQKVSWVYGQMVLSGSSVTKDEVRKRLEANR